MENETAPAFESAATHAAAGELSGARRLGGFVPQGAEGVETPACDRPTAPTFGELGDAASVELDEAVDDRDHRAGVDVAVDEMAPAKREACPATAASRRQT